MTYNEIVALILMIVLIVASVYLIIVLWRMNRILKNLDDAMLEIKETVNKVSSSIKSGVEKIVDFSSNVALISNFVEKIGEVIKDRFQKNSNKKNKNKE